MPRAGLISSFEDGYAVRQTLTAQPVFFQFISCGSEACGNTVDAHFSLLSYNSEGTAVAASINSLSLASLSSCLFSLFSIKSGRLS